MSAPQACRARSPRSHPGLVMSPPIDPVGVPSSSIVIVSARSADHEPCSMLHHLLSARAQRRRSSKAHWGGEKPATNSRGSGVGRGCPAEGGETAVAAVGPEPCSKPSCRACHQVPRTWTMPVPGGVVHRHLAKRLPETVCWPSRVKLFKWAAFEGVGIRRGRAIGVRAKLRAPRRVRPRGLRSQVPAALGDRVLPRSCLARAQQQQRRHQADPHRDDPPATPARPRHDSSLARQH